jgi:Protein of unknown function (DUF3828)
MSLQGRSPLCPRALGLLVACAVVASVGPNAASAGPLPQAAATSVASSASPEATVEQFYRWYVGNLKKHIEPRTDRSVEMRRFVTARLMSQLGRKAGVEEPDADYFLDAQDYDDAWEDRISTARQSSHGAVAVLLVTLDGPQIPHHQLKVTLRKEDSAWKIDSVSGVQHRKG